MIRGRMTVQPSESFVLFLIGMRFNQPWKIHKWWPVVTAMPKMLTELAQTEDSGYLSGEAWYGRTTMMLQYWASFDALEAYAKNKQQAHFPAWVKFNQTIGKHGDIGIWHETYEIQPNRMECIYVNMPLFGLGRANTLVAAQSEFGGARKRFFQE
ncbi:MAG: DUF4188 domain-containing protein [Gammaproteobacteria bacterium]|nr:DUF4188 domain-containing protein [Gammaproteobacteria bacterium]